MTTRVKLLLTPALDLNHAAIQKRLVIARIVSLVNACD
jgi:hypothetical protein